MPINKTKSRKAIHPSTYYHKQPALIKCLMISALLLSGALQTFSLAPFELWFLGPLSIVLFILTTKALNAPRKGTPYFFFGWLFGLGLFGSGASWVYVSIHTYGHAPPLLAGSLTLIFVAGLALFPAATFYTYGRFKTGSKAGNALLLIACWVLGDFFRTFFLTGFPWLFLGYAHLNTPLAGWVPIIGVYGITALVVASGIGLYFLASLLIKALPLISKRNNQKVMSHFKSHYHPQKTAIKLIYLFVTSLFWVSGPVLNQTEWTQDKADAIDVALLQTNIDQEEKWKASQREKTLILLEEMTEAAWHTDLVLWPETAIPLLYDQARPFIDFMDEAAKEHQTTIISGLPYREINYEERTQVLHNSIISLGLGSGIYHKQKLVPFGEYVPLQDLLRGLIAFFDLPMSDFRTGSPEQAPLKAANLTIAPFICYEVVYPDFVANNAVASELLLTISNDSWFGSSIGPLQHLQMAQMRAAETRRFMIRGTNNGVSAMINERGQLLAESEQFVQTTLFASAQPKEGQTPFMCYGSWPVGLLCLLVVIVCATKRYTKDKPKQEYPLNAN